MGPFFMKGGKYEEKYNNFLFLQSLLWFNRNIKLKIYCIFKNLLVYLMLLEQWVNQILIP